MLEKFPDEIICLILNQLPDRRDLKSVCAISKKLYDLAIPILYETIIANSKSERHIEKIKFKSLLTSSSPKRLQYTRHVKFAAPFYRNLKERCLHMRDINNSAVFNKLEGSQEGKFQTMANNALSLLQQLTDERLKSFSWQLGTCIPAEILGSGGYLPLKQSSLEEISLMTGPICPLQYDEETVPGDIDLSRFHSLRRISWIDFRPKLQFRRLRDALKINAKHLTHLQLEFSNEEYIYDSQDTSEEKDTGSVYYNNVLARDILELKRSTTPSKAKFPALDSLSLGYINLSCATRPLAHALNISKLSHLVLHKCLFIGDFLRRASSLGTLKLLSLELTSIWDDIPRVEETLVDVFAVAPYLNDLFLLLLYSEMGTLRFWQALADKGPPLRRFIYHLRDVGNEEVEADEELALEVEDVEKLKTPPASEQHPFARFNLECLGLSGNMMVIKSILQSPSATKSLKLLHLRKAGPNMTSDMDIRSSIENIGWSSPSSNTDAEERVKVRQENNLEDAHRNDYQLIDDMSMDVLEGGPKDLLPFARWAFGVNGIASLQVLAYGDFSFDGRFKMVNYLFCRRAKDLLEDDSTYRTLPFRHIRDDDVSMMELVNQNMDFLEACPADSRVFKEDEEEDDD